MSIQAKAQKPALFKSVKLDEQIQWGGDDAFTHTLVVGPTRCGKTATILKPMIHRILDQKRRGIPVGISVIEPKGDVARMVKEMAEEMGLSDELVYIDPMFSSETKKINVMKGEKNAVAEATVAVLKSLFGKQEAFFATVQELSARKITTMLKILYEDNIDITDVLENLRDPVLLQRNVKELRRKPGNEDLVQFFDNELLGSDKMAEKYQQLIIGLRAQLENITSNEDLKRIVTGKSDIDLDEHFEKGGILAVNTALGLLGRAGDAFGMFIAMHLQLATFRRKGTERTRVPHYLIIDEYSRYINPDVERFLSIAAEYRVALIAAIQSFGQLELESGVLSARAMKRAIMTSTRNKIVFGGLEYEDAEEVAKIMGSDIVKERTKTYEGGFLEQWFPKSYKDDEKEKERFHPTMLMDGLPRFHFVHKLLVNGTPQEPGIGVGEFVPRDWAEKMKEEGLLPTLKKPPIWDWRARAVYRVSEYKKALREEELEQKHAVFEHNPFEQVEKPVLTNNETIFTFKTPSVRKKAEEVQEPLQESEQPLAKDPAMTGSVDDVQEEPDVVSLTNDFEFTELNNPVSPVALLSEEQDPDNSLVEEDIQIALEQTKQILEINEEEMDIPQEKTNNDSASFSVDLGVDFSELLAGAKDSVEEQKGGGTHAKESSNQKDTSNEKKTSVSDPSHPEAFLKVVEDDEEDNSFW